MHIFFQDLLTYEAPGLQKLWEEVAEQSVSRQHLIKQLDTTLAAIEKERMQEVCEILLYIYSTYSDSFIPLRIISVA